MWINSVYERWWRRGKRSSRPDSQKLESRSESIFPLTPSVTSRRYPADILHTHAGHEYAVDVEKAVVSHGRAALECKTRAFSTYNVSTRGISSDPAPAVGRGQDVFGSRRTGTRCVGIIRLLRYSVFTVYRRLFTLVFVVNLIAAGLLYKHRQYHQRRQQQGPDDEEDNSIAISLNINTLSTLASANFLAAILVRQDWFVNLLFRSAWLVPWNVPLSVRKMVARVYCYGGIHSGAAVAGTMWWIAFTTGMSVGFVESGDYGYTVLVSTWVVLILLMMTLLFAIPGLRARYHDMFEMTHRFLGWSSIAIFWFQLLVLVQSFPSSSSSLGSDLVRNPTFWNLTLITILVIYPWLLLRRWTFIARPLSTHALHLSFPNAIHKFSCLAISSSPLREWHPFATFPSADLSDPCASMVISDAGDWTRNLIRSVIAQTKASGKDAVKVQFYIKSHPSAGVLSLTCLFPRILIVTTGSGIGPCLSSLVENTLASSHSCRYPRQFARLVWSSRSPLKTFGPHIMGLVNKADPDAVVIDTAEMGRPDLLEVAWSMYRELEVEAVFVLSNQKVVDWVVGGLERRGVPAFGPIWDS
ncbi:hypothetical protein PTNB73_03696 [Pyrenophora teres f. teres]|nr:hypothetical protein PTNB85_02514 [Pyrenophora teres f. teres]KAE8847548.1 hypothetical protein HRS9122_04455 [Pyrenophora teres f. teres]KAE8872237.1 hypothetical protein PTNB73_03696 [Pyrenophora teres f. teres]